MKKIVFIVFLVLLLTMYWRFVAREPTIPLSISKQTPSPIVSTVKEVATKESTSAFVPYWVLGQKELSADYDSLIYFGISPNVSGIDTNELGYKNISRFVENVPPSTKTQLTVRMINNEASFAILESVPSSKKVITDAVTIAKENGFEGILLDLEVNALPFDSVVKNITDFTKQFGQAVHDADLEFGMAIYGDVYYRLRPFKVKELAQHVDQIYIMAYDLHKARGNPGPNFPYSGKDQYGYDFQTMIADYLEDVPSDKLTVVFGMFGYDWEVNDKGKAIGNGESMSYYKIKQQFMDSCSEKKCEYAQDPASLETKLTYIDKENKEHVVWFESPTSVAEKKRYSNNKGITGISYWAYSYF